MQYILGLKVGIGRSILEANEALKTATEKKPKIFDTDTPQQAMEKITGQIRDNNLAIHIYDGPSLEKTHLSLPIHEQVQRSLQRYRELSQLPEIHPTAVETFMGQLLEHSYDPATGALTPFGYELELQQDEPPKNTDGQERFFFLVDANDMHYWNAQGNYDDVSAHLARMGQGLVQAVRMKKPRNPRDERRTITDIPLDRVVQNSGLVTRTHGTAGDEFLIDLYCHEQDRAEIARRILLKGLSEQWALYHE